MKEGYINKYIAAFKQLAHHANADLDNVMNLHLFACSLPKPLCDICINIDSPKTFKQWLNAAQHHQHNWLYKQAIKNEYGMPQPPQCTNNNEQCHGNFGNFYWR